jgi:hypothetical protein
MTSDRRWIARAAAALCAATLLAGGAATVGAAGVGAQRVGTTAGSFLKIGVGARAVGMGESFVAVANDPSTIYWNPAGVASLIRREGAISHVSWPADIAYEHLTYIAPVRSIGGSIGLQFGMLHTDIQETTEERPFGTGVTFTYADWLAGATYGRRLTDRLLVGVGGKLVHEDLGADVGGTSVNTWLVDIGSIYYLGISSVRIAMTLANFGPDFQPGGDYTASTGEVRAYDAFSPPTTFRFGVAWEPIEREQQRLTTSIEFNQPSDNQLLAKAGLEYEVNRRFAVRTGYNVNADELKWSAGAGFYPTFGTTRGTFDYAYTDGGVLGAVHRISVGARF